MSLNYLATRFTCSWPWSIAVMLCDGRVVCGCADPYAKRVLGDVRADELRAMARRILKLATVDEVERELLAALGRLSHARE